MDKLCTMFSVIIPIYNKAAYIEKSILSVLNQTYTDFELIIINDGSTDHSLALLLELQAEHNHSFIVLNQENKGVSSARNNGVKVSKNDYIAFLDADDWWDVSYLEEMNILIQSFPEAGVYGSSYFKVKNGKTIPAIIGVDTSLKMGLIDYFQTYINSPYMPLWTGSTVVKRTVFETENGFKKSLKMGEDFDLWVRIANKYPVAYLNKALAFYNQDVDLSGRAVGNRLYEPFEHMLFTNYDALQTNLSFHFLFEKLALYGLLPYYLEEKNKVEVSEILSKIEWNRHPFKYNLYYRLLPKYILLFWMNLLKFGVQIKLKLKQ